MEDDFRQLGKISRKKKEVKFKAYQPLSGNEGKELYLECLQFVLYQEVVWLVSEKGVHPELMDVVKDLWDLRTRGFVGLKVVKSASKEKGRGKQQVVSSAQMVAEGEMVEGSRKRRKPWFGEDWVLPTMMDILGILYLGCVLRDEPVRIGDICRWAMSNQLPWLTAVNKIPEDWRDRLPSWARRVMLTRWVKSDGSRLHHAVKGLILGYREHYDDVMIPKLNYPHLILLWMRDLALPVEIYGEVQEICFELGLTFTFPTREKRAKGLKVENPVLLDLPDVLLAASVIAATKYIYPLDDVERVPWNEEDPLRLKMDWALWMTIFPEPDRKKKRTAVDFENIMHEEIWKMSEEEGYEYLDWFRDTNLKATSRSPTELFNLFPRKPQTTKPVVQSSGEGGTSDVQGIGDDEIGEDRTDARIKRIVQAMKRVKPQPNGADVYRLGDKHRFFKNAEELVDPWKRLYQIAADRAGLDLKDLVREVYRLENMWFKHLDGRDR